MKKVLLLLADGFEEIEALTIVDILRRASISVHMCSINEEYVRGAHMIIVKSDILIEDIDSDYDMVVLPGGMVGALNLNNDERVIELIRKYFFQNIWVSAICAAPLILNTARILEGKNVTSYPGILEGIKGFQYLEDAIVVDGNLITSRGPGLAMEFSLKLVQVLEGKEKEDSLRESLLYFK